jgi:outer membrane receptor protein involved in Fe transport
LGDPKYQGQLSANIITKTFNLGYRIRYIGKTTIFTYETQNSFDGRPPQKIDANPIVFYPASTYQDFRLDITPTGRFKFYVGVDNAFDKLAPYDLLGTEGGSPYDPVGRFFYAGVDFKL